jgi:large repetitive protein
VTVAANGAYLYTPTTGYTGADSFIYTVTDAAGQTSTATVTLSVTAGPVPPSASDDTIPAVAGVPTSWASVLGNDTGTSITVTSFTQPSHGTVTISPSGVVTYTGTAGFTGPDSFTYTITDSNGLTATATVRLNVSAEAANDNVETVAGTPTVIGVLSNDTPGMVAGTLTVTVSPLHGTVTVNPDGTITYVPNPEYSGPDSFVYVVQRPDGSTYTATVTLMVKPVATADSVTVTQGVATKIAVLSNDTGTLVPGSVRVVSQPSHGTVTANADGTITYLPDAGYTGDDTFQYSAKDASGNEVVQVVHTTVQAVANVRPGLPVSGADVLRLLFAALVFALMGAALVFAQRRRNRTTSSRS